MLRLNPTLTLPQHVTPPPDAQKNFLVVDAKTDNAAIEAAFDRFTAERKDIAILLINQHVRCPLSPSMLQPVA
jgi:vacuolar-type H+-ATPase subunit F/Vma7